MLPKIPQEWLVSRGYTIDEFEALGNRGSRRDRIIGMITKTGIEQEYQKEKEVEDATK